MRVGTLVIIVRAAVRRRLTCGPLVDDGALGQVADLGAVRDGAVARDEHAAAGARRILAEHEPAERRLHLHAARRVQRRRLRVQRVQRRLVQQRDDLRGLWGVSARARGVRLYVCRPAFLREDMCSGECAASHRRTQSRSFFSFTWASGSWRRAYVWYCGRE